MEIMIDLETMSKAHNAAIASIGAVAFTEDGIVDTFYCNVDIESAEQRGGVISADTVKWWLNQDKEAIDALFYDEPQDLKQCLLALNKFFARFTVQGVWAYGVVFDNVILKEAYKSCEMEVPWGYRSDRCYRTVSELYPEIKFEMQGTQHNALDDAKAQTLHLIKILNQIKKGNPNA